MYSCIWNCFSYLHFNYFHFFIKINLPYIEIHQINKTTLKRNPYKRIILVFYVTSAVHKMEKFGFMLYNEYFCFSDEGSLRAEICRNVTCDIITQISKKQFCEFYWFSITNMYYRYLFIYRLTDWFIWALFTHILPSISRHITFLFQMSYLI
jgi:hypothetical protein